MENTLVTVSGPPASGTSTLCNSISEEIEAKVISAGDIFYELANEKGMTPKEFSELAEKKPEFDREIDNTIKERMTEHYNGNTDFRNLIVDSRLAGWHGREISDLQIYLKAPIDVRYQRLDERDENVEQIEKREESERSRYMEHYGIDINDLSVYDLVIDTSVFSEDEVRKITLTAVRNNLF